MSHDTWASGFVQAVEKHARRPFLRQLGSADVTYEEATSRVAAIIEKLTRLGIKPGDPVVCYSERIVPSIYLVAACSVMGVPYVAVSPVYSVAFIQDIVKRIGATWMYCDPENESQLRERGAQLIDLDLQTRPRDPRAVIEAAAAKVTGKSPLVLLSTSGSSGNPKLVSRNQASFARHGTVLAQAALGYGSAEHRFLMAHTLTHGFGFNILTTAVWTGGLLLVPPTTDVATRVDDVRKLDPTMLWLTPRVLRSLQQQADASGGAGSRLFGPNTLALFTAGSRSDPATLQRLRKEGVDIIEIYTASECGLVALTPRNQWKPESIGPVLPDVTVRFAPDGEILARTPSLMDGYYGDAELTRNAFTEDGFYRTGDVGEQDASGYLRIVGRKSDSFGTLEGAAIYPSTIEGRIESLPWAEQAFLVQDAQLALTAFIVLKDRAHGTSEDDGFLPEEQARELYERAWADITSMNAGLERFERVVRIALLTKPLAPEVYRVVALAKVKRERKAFADKYGKRIAEVHARPAR